MADLSSSSADDNDSFSSASVSSSGAASSCGRKISKKPESSRKDRANANAALSNRGCAHSNSATAVASCRSSASAADINSASALGSSKKRGNHLIFDPEDDSATEVSVVRKKHKKGDLTCKRGSVGQSEGLSIPRSSFRFRLKTRYLKFS